MRLKLLAISLLAVLLAAAWFASERRPRVDFNTQIKPIFNQKCLKCHGGVRQLGGLSFLTRDLALAQTANGRWAILPGNSSASELIRRLTCPDPEQRMPLGETPLSQQEVDLLARWIDEGAAWGTHWAYRKLEKPPVPQPRTAWSFWGKTEPRWGRNDVDAFVLERLEKEKLAPSPEAEKATLLRRVALDLTGLPPSQKLAEQFLNDSSSTAYERAVDSLLADPGFGERWATVWLDLARYADSKGYERDVRRNIWRYRDWLVRAFNEDKPYDQFLTEQLAGDLLPNPTDDQRIATAFHRNTPTNDEGGTDNEEFRTAAVLDRVNTTWTAVLGTTFNCVQCHSHPYDPFFHDEYYQFLAFFNQTRDVDTYDDFPLLRIYSGKDSLKLLQLKNWLTKNVEPAENERVMNMAQLWQPVWSSVETDSLERAALLDTKWLGLSFGGSARLPNVNLAGAELLTARLAIFKKGGSVSVRLWKKDGPEIARIPCSKLTKSWEIHSFDLNPLRGVLAWKDPSLPRRKPHPLDNWERGKDGSYQGWLNRPLDLFLVYDNPKLAKDPDAFGIQFDWFNFGKKFPGREKTDGAKAEKNYWELLRAGCATIPTMFENSADFQRVTHVFERGNWLVHGPEVRPATPKNLNPFPENAPPNRLGLARWLTDPANPLTARVMVNRLWEQLFGTGIVETLEDFGTQGAEPSHPALLDYLAWRFSVDNQWSMKKILREMVLSATYRQASVASPDSYRDALLERDPQNRLLARGPRVRLSGEQLRDQALAVSGLLSRKQFGTPVMPYQPEGIWQNPWNGDKWTLSDSTDRHRRSLYTFWKRSNPYPSTMIFDGATRQVCTARRTRTNTPLQALVTLNDPVFVECAQAFARRLVGEKSGTASAVNSLIPNAFEQAAGRKISPEKLAVLEKLFAETQAHYAAKPAAAKQFLKQLPAQFQTVEVAALAVVCNAILNLDEVVSR